MDEEHNHPITRLNRRQFLNTCVVGTLAVSVAACSETIPSTGSTTTPVHAATTAPTNTPQPTKPPAPDWSTLSKQLQGELVRPGSSQYATAHQLFSPAFDSVQPEGVAYCASPKDVQSCLAFVQKYQLPLAIRCGGHSYAGYSTGPGLVLDVTRMSKITVDTGASTATIGAGARLIDIYSALTQQGMILPAGSCPTVGISGLAMGGGAGVIDRKYGLTCDSLLSAQVVLADGRTVTCDANHEPELFWSLRGGGGGNFGVTTSFTFRTYQLANVTIFTLRWPWANAATIVDAWQHWAPQAPDELWSNCLLSTSDDKSSNPIVQVNGTYIGSVAQLNAILQQLTSQIDAQPGSQYVDNVSTLDAMLYEAGCKSVESCHLPSQNPQGTLARDASRVRSDYFTKALPKDGIAALINAINTRHASTTLGNGGIGMDSLGGAVNRVAASATAFVHRNALFSAQYSGSWNASAPTSVVKANSAWLDSTWQSMRRYSSGASYQNYVDPDLTNWQQAYYGDNLPRLQRAKSQYDPHNLFHFAQSIPPAR